MPLGIIAINNYRNREWKQTLGYMANVAIGSLKISNSTVSGVQVRVRQETADTLAGLHKSSIDSAVRDVVAAGHALPDLDFYLCSNGLIPNVAMKVYTGDTPKPIIFLGPNMWAKNAMQPGTNGVVTGGLGFGMRGVANQAYDGTQRWFGNPKIKAQGATIVIHELAHILHEINNPGVFWEELQAAEAQNASPNGAGWQAQSVDVSHYAGKNALEFVAEVFAGKIIGKVYPDTVMDVYRNLGGP